MSEALAVLVILSLGVAIAGGIMMLGCWAAIAWLVMFGKDDE